MARGRRAIEELFQDPAPERNELWHKIACQENAAERAVALNPRNSHTRAYLGLLIAFSGEWDGGLALVQRAMALNPHFPNWCYLPYFYNHYRKGEYQKALQLSGRAAGTSSSSPYSSAFQMANPGLLLFVPVDLFPRLPDRQRRSVLTMRNLPFPQFLSVLVGKPFILFLADAVSQPSVGVPC